MFTEVENHDGLEEAISHHELLRGTRDVAVVMEDAHASETGDVDLESDVIAETDVDAGLVGGESTHGQIRGEVVECLVSDFINHFYN